jgi:hypothetical protein
MFEANRHERVRNAMAHTLNDDEFGVSNALGSVYKNAVFNEVVAG